ncbi:MAG: hypothetical protein HOP23_05630 [Methylococcaceae bacterium]|nr:hypothetical protein [Methylococcaceae bacterium]
MADINFTTFQSSTPLTKRYSLSTDGTIVKTPAAQMTSGVAKHVNTTFEKFAESLDDAPSNVAFGYGVPIPKLPRQVTITTSGKEQPEVGIVSRSKRFFQYQNEPGILMLDRDPSEYGKSFTPDELINTLIGIDPAIGQAARVVRGSVSAGVHREGGVPKLDGGFHFYIPVQNAADIPRYGRTLFDRLWLSGHGYIALAANGSALIRSPIDGAVFSPERLDFVAPPIIDGTGLSYTAPETQYTEGNALDTTMLLNLSEVVQQWLEWLQAGAIQAAKPLSTAKCLTWADAKVSNMVAAGVDTGAARAAVDAMVSSDCRDLYGQQPLQFTTGTVTVADVLANPEAYDGRALADPVEGVEYGATTAKFYWNNGIKPYINSMAHGGCKYFLHAIPKQAKQVTSLVNQNDQVKTTAVAMLLANIQPVPLIDICIALGWQQGTSGDLPRVKHYVVAIIHVLIETARRNNWNLIHNAGFFYIYNGAHWVSLVDGEVKQLLKEAAIRMSYTEIECRHCGFVDTLFKQTLQDGFFIESSVNKQSIINLKNGSLVLSEKGVTLKPFECQDFLTHQLDFAYDASAVNSVFLDYLTQVLPDADTRKTLQQVAGYLFVKGLKMEKIFFLFGTGANGKSVFFEVLNGVVGSDNISNYSLESLTDDKGYHRAMIKDKIVNYGTDIRLTRIDAGMFKTLASGEPVEARLPYRDPFLMTDYAKLIFNINRMESANIEHTHGFYRRLLIIPFNVMIPDGLQDRDLHKKILNDKAGVLNWIIEGAEQVIKNRDIFISRECENFKQQFLKEADSVAMFEEDLRESSPHSIYVSTVKLAHLNYKIFCIDAGHKPLGRSNFSKRMEALGFEKRKVDKGIVLEKHYF